ncbi:MAG: sigma-70 family RNA polymerase sigma factor [Gemmatimonadaceae bacterium]
MSDAELVAATRAGNTQAFAQLVRRYRDRHARFASRMLGDRDDAEDVLQSAFLRAYRGLARCEDSTRFGAWLHAIVVNECRTFATRRGVRERRLVRDPMVIDGVASAGAPAADSALRRAIERALEELPVDQREAFVLKHVEELEYEEMAEVTGAGVSALKMRVKRACERLRERLQGVVDD